MSWFRDLVETYDRASEIVGISDQKGNVLWPLYHIASSSQICLTIDGNGRFRNAEKKEKRIIIPGTEKSFNRTGTTIAPHSLHEKLEYLALNQEKHDQYLQQLAAWKSRHPKLQAVYQYVLAGTLLADVEGSGLEVKKDLFVRFRVEMQNDFTPNLWEDMKIIEAWINYYEAVQGTERRVCYATGEEAFPAGKHLNGINPFANNARLISCNDKDNYTYKGRFLKEDSPNCIGAKSSHKVHAMLNYLVATQGYRGGQKGKKEGNKQAVVVWTLNDVSVQPDPFENSFDLYQKAKKTDHDKLLEIKEEQLGNNYARGLRKALCGLDSHRSLINTNRQVVIIALDAPTVGRMGITFYQKLRENEYVERLVNWHETCCWWLESNGHEHISAPSVNKMILAVYGEPKNERDIKNQKQAKLRFLYHIFEGETLSKGWINAAVARVSNPFSYTKQRNRWDKQKWLKALSVTCALVKKSYNRKKEVFTLELDRNCTDRDYLFGRLLAIADKIESHARYVQKEKDDVGERPTNAVRYLPAFAAKPMRTWNLIYTNLNPYIQCLNGAKGYQQQIDEVMSLFEPEQYNDRQLSGIYLHGYSLQRRYYAMNNKNTTKQNNQQEESENEFDE